MDPYADTPMVCIGGVSDGERIASYGPTMEQPHRPSIRERFPSGNPDMARAPLPKRDLYRREQISFASGLRIMFWRFDRLETSAAVQRVFDAYGHRK